MTHFRENIMQTPKQEPAFIGRERELAQLRSTLDQSRPSISVIYGRRRVGKSALIRKALEGRPAFFFEGLENQATSEQISNFCLQFSKQTGRSAGEEEPTSWRQAFLLLEPG